MKIKTTPTPHELGCQPVSSSQKMQKTVKRIQKLLLLNERIKNLCPEFEGILL
jgi:hypothetical protein